jgi:hypothetical protein
MELEFEDEFGNSTFVQYQTTSILDSVAHSCLTQSIARNETTRYEAAEKRNSNLEETR